MAHSFRIFAGVRPAAGQPAADHSHYAAFALHIADVARSYGMAASIEASRVTVSASRYVNITDKGGRLWIVRISDHHQPNATGAPKPHIDIISHDGIEGRDLAGAIVTGIQTGDIHWFDAGKSRNRRQRRRR